MNFHSGLRYQRGRGFGSLFAGLLKGFAPLARMGLSAGKKLISSDLVKNVASTALDSGKQAIKHLAADLLEGRDISSTAKDELSDARKKIASTLRGSGRKNKKRKNILKSKKKNIKRQKLRFNLLEDE